MAPHQLDATTAWAGAFAYTLQIYFDFAGYSLMAIGLGRIIGFQLPQNFNYPYVAISITDFWRRWHISLSSWLRDYLYIPLGGNRKGTAWTCFNIVVVFTLCGLWHGAAWTYIAWGVFHGLLLIAERLFLGKLLACLPSPVPTLYTVLMVTVGWVLFRADNLATAWGFLSTMFTIPSMGTPRLPQIINNRNLFFGITGIIFSTPIMPFLRAGCKQCLSTIGMPMTGQAALGNIVTLSLFVCCAISIMAGTYNPFIYFQF
jgi:alginate O-acetyltransferase complex protein AlgI